MGKGTDMAGDAVLHFPAGRPQSPREAAHQSAVPAGKTSNHKEQDLCNSSLGYPPFLFCQNLSLTMYAKR